MRSILFSLLLAWCAQINTSAQTTPTPQGGGVATNSFENSLGLKFVSVPGAKVQFCIWETRVQDYQKFTAATGRAWTKPDFEQGPLHPVVNITWEDAAAFCNWLTSQERKSGMLTSKQRYRLPTDLEWSAAAGCAAEAGKTPEERMKTLMVWPWGYYWPPHTDDGNYGPELGVDRFAETSPVGSFKPNAFGLYDVGGNVWEWCEDWYNNASVTRALRGGSFHDSQPKDLLSAYRFSGTMHLNNDDIGFRMVLETKE